MPPLTKAHLSKAKTILIQELSALNAFLKKPAVTRSLLVLLFGLASIYLMINARKLLEFEWQLRFGWLLGAVGLIILAVPLIRTGLWHLILRRLGGVLSFWESFRIIRLSQLAKYLPGQLWHYAGIFYLANQIGVPKKQTLASILYDQGTSLIAGALVILVSTLSLETLNQTTVWLVVSANLVIGLGLICHPLVYKLGNSVLRVLSIDSLAELPTLSIRTILSLILSNALFWLILGSSMFFIIRGVTSSDISWVEASMPGIIGTLGGLVVILAPSGIGVTEGLLVFLLQEHFPTEICLAISLLFRVLNTSKEILLGLIAARIKHPSREPK